GRAPRPCPSDSCNRILASRTDCPIGGLYGGPRDAVAASGEPWLVPFAAGRFPLWWPRSRCPGAGPVSRIVSKRSRGRPATGVYASLAGGDRGSRQGFAVSASRGPAECDGGPRPWTGGSGGLAEGGRGAVPRAVPRVGFVVDDAALNDAAGTGPRVTARGGCAGDVILQGEQVCFHAGAHPLHAPLEPAVDGSAEQRAGHGKGEERTQDPGEEPGEDEKG